MRPCKKIINNIISTVQHLNVQQFKAQNVLEWNNSAVKHHGSKHWNTRKIDDYLLWTVFITPTPVNCSFEHCCQLQQSNWLSATPTPILQK